MAKEDTREAEPKNLNSQIYEMYVKGANPATIAEAHDLDNLSVLAIIQEVQSSKSKD